VNGQWLAPMPLLAKMKADDRWRYAAADGRPGGSIHLPSGRGRRVAFNLEPGFGKGLPLPSGGRREQEGKRSFQGIGGIGCASIE